MGPGSRPSGEVWAFSGPLEAPGQEGPARAAPRKEPGLLPLVQRRWGAAACVPGGQLPWAGVAPSVPPPLQPARLGPQPPQRLLKGAGFLLPTGLLATCPPPSLPPRGSRPGGARPPLQKKEPLVKGTKSQVTGSAIAKVIIELRTGGMRSCQNGGRQRLPAWRQARPLAVGTRGRVAVLGRRPRSARRVSDGLVVTHVPDLRGEGETLSVRPPRGCLRAAWLRPRPPISTEAPPCFSWKETREPGTQGPLGCGRALPRGSCRPS